MLINPVGKRGGPKYGYNPRWYDKNLKEILLGILVIIFIIWYISFIVGVNWAEDIFRIFYP